MLTGSPETSLKCCPEMMIPHQLLAADHPETILNWRPSSPGQAEAFPFQVKLAVRIRVRNHVVSECVSHGGTSRMHVHCGRVGLITCG